MRQVWLLLVGALLAAGLTEAAPAQTLMGDRDDGYALARKTCARCHRVGKAEDTPKLYPASAFQDIADNPASTELSLRVFLRSPHRDMPDLILTDAEIDNVVAYILGLR